jgi:DNA-binding transcriptional LysR family regulator
MNWASISFDWNQIRAFLATVEEGSFSAAARALGQTQPTLSRQISALETDLGVTLFERGRRSMAPTQAALELLDHVRVMGEAAQRISLTASGQSTTIDGHVSITATDVMASFFLPPVVRHLREIAPNLTLEVIASNALQDLSKREADIAIRHARPEKGELIARKIGETTAHLFASKAYLDRVGRPQSLEALNRMNFIGFGNETQVIGHLNALGLSLTPDNVPVICESGAVYLSLLREGLGVAVMTRDVQRFFPELEPVWPDLPEISVPIWLVTHRELQTSRKIRLVFDTLAEHLRAIW